MADTEADKGRTPGGASKVSKRSRGASFPAIPLADAVALVKKIASYGTTHTNAAIASFLGHQTANSGPYRTKVAALKDFGLLTGRGDELTVTPLALQLTNPGLDPNVQDCLATAFGSCRLFLTVYEALPTGRELDVQALANSALHNHGVATQAKDSFAKSFVKSGVTAGLFESLDNNKIRLSEKATTTTIPIEHEAPTPEDGDLIDKSSERNEASTLRLPTNAVVNHIWPIDDGVIHFIIESSRPLPAAAYGVIGTVIEAGDKLANMLGIREVALEDGSDS